MKALKAGIGVVGFCIVFQSGICKAEIDKQKLLATFQANCKTVSSSEVAQPKNLHQRMAIEMDWVGTIYLAPFSAAIIDDFMKNLGLDVDRFFEDSKGAAPVETLPALSQEYQARMKSE